MGPERESFGGRRLVLATPNDGLTTTDLVESVMAECQFIRDSRSPSHPLLSMIAACLGQRGRTLFRPGGGTPQGLSLTGSSSAI